MGIKIGAWDNTIKLRNMLIKKSITELVIWIFLTIHFAQQKSYWLMGLGIILILGNIMIIKSKRKWNKEAIKQHEKLKNIPKTKQSKKD